MLLLRLETQQRVAIEQHAVARVRGDFEHAGVHANRVFGTGFYAITAEHALAEIDIKLHRILLNLLLRPLARDDVDALRRAHGFAHHARDAARRAVFAFGETMQRAQPRPKKSPHFGILKRDRAFLITLHAQAGEREMPQIVEEATHGEHQPVPNAREIRAFPKGERFIFVVDVHGLVAGRWLLVAG